MTIIAELKRRKVFRVAAAYAVVGWLLIEVAATIAPQLQFPEWVPRLITFLILLGFPIALVMAWVFDVTPEGLKLDATGTGSKRLFAIATLLALLVLGWYFRGRPEAVADGDDRRSIAVLPFVNMSGDKNNEFFSDGISEEILNVLAQLPDLRVAARTSSFSFRGGKAEVPEIARQLQVRMVLEGSVRKQGEKVRITAQLIDAKTGYHVWSQTYDRDLKDIFAIQDEIARAIGEELKLKLADAPRPDAARKVDAVAYSLYLQGMQKWQARGADNLLDADHLFRAALARDSGFARAWAGLALTQTVLPEWAAVAREQTYPIARDAAEHSLALDPDQPEPYAALASMASSELRLDTARAMMKRALAVSPSYATGYQWLSETLAVDGELDQSLEAIDHALMLDPKSQVMRNARTNTLFNQGRYEDALAQCQIILAEDPDWGNCKLVKMDVAMLNKDWAAARAVLREMAAPRGAQARLLAEQTMDVLEGKGDANAVAARLVAAPDGYLDPKSVTPFSPLESAVWFMALGRKSDAIERLEYYSGYLPHVVRGYLFAPILVPLRCELRFQALAAKLQVPTARRIALCPRGQQGTP